MPVTKLGDPTVNYISLVHRGANRIPFRIVKHDKQESNMIDLASLNVSRLFKAEKDKVVKEQPQPTIVGFVTMKDEHFDMVKDGLKDAGFLVSKQYDEVDGSTVFKQVDNIPDDFTVLKMGDHLLALITGVDTDALVKDTIYESLLKEDSFIPSPDIATQGFSLAMNEISNSDDTMQDKVTKMELVTKDYNGYLKSLFSWIPARLNALAKELEANIADHAVQEANAASMAGKVQGSPRLPNGDGIDTGGSDGVEAKNSAKPSAFNSEIDDRSMATRTNASISKAGKVPEGFVPFTKETAPNGDGAKAKKPVKAEEEDPFEEKGEMVEEDETPEEKAKEAFPPKSKGKSCKDEDPMTDLVSKMEAMLANMQTAMQDLVMKQVAEVSATVNTLKKSQDSLHDRVVEAEKVAKSAEATIRGKVITSDIGNDYLPNVQKAETFDSQGFGGCIDTAFQTTVRKQAQSSLQRVVRR
jgi:hypothetical protein